jgi:hypothetical protein
MLDGMLAERRRDDIANVASPVAEAFSARLDL